jgi:plasmid stabilization system protein ParE
MAHLIWTEPALRDLENIAETIALDKPEAARSFVRRVFRAAERLNRFPRSGRRPPETAGLPYREIIVPPCRVFYRVSGRSVYVLHVMRGEQLFRPEILEERTPDA